MKIKSSFSSFSVKDIVSVKSFYQEALGLEVKETEMGGLDIKLPNAEEIYIYSKKDHQPANFTVLNFEVENIDEAVDELVSRGVHFEHYEGFGQDGKGVARGRRGHGPSIAWFKDPAGNILSVLEMVK